MKLSMICRCINMGLRVEYREYNEDTLEVFLSEIEKDAEKTEKEMLEEAAEKVKEYVVANLNKHRRVLAVRYKGRPAMADDVKISIRTEKWGGRYARVMGGKMTGTLWHLVNDGTLHAMGTHFMDGALARLDGSIDKLWDEIMR